MTVYDLLLKNLEDYARSNSLLEEKGLPTIPNYIKQLKKRQSLALYLQQLSLRCFKVSPSSAYKNLLFLGVLLGKISGSFSRRKYSCSFKLKNTFRTTMQHNFLFIIFFLISPYSIENEFIQVRHQYPSTINEDHK